MENKVDAEVRMAAGHLGVSVTTITDSDVSYMASLVVGRTEATLEAQRGGRIFHIGIHEDYPRSYASEHAKTLVEWFSGEVRADFVQKVLASLVDLGWKNQGSINNHLSWVTKEIGGGHKNMVNPKGIRRLSARFNDTQFIARHGDNNVIAQVPCAIDGDPEAIAKALDAAVKAADPDYSGEDEVIDVNDFVSGAPVPVDEIIDGQQLIEISGTRFEWNETFRRYWTTEGDPRELMRHELPIPAAPQADPELLRRAEKIIQNYRDAGRDEFADVVLAGVVSLGHRLSANEVDFWEVQFERNMAGWATIDGAQAGGLAPVSPTLRTLEDLIDSPYEARAFSTVPKNVSDLVLAQCNAYISELAQRGLYLDQVDSRYPAEIIKIKNKESALRGLFNRYAKQLGAIDKGYKRADPVKFAETEAELSAELGADVAAARTAPAAVYVMPDDERAVIREILTNSNRDGDTGHVLEAIESAGGYSAIVEDEAKWREYDDLIDPLVSQRIVDVRNALRETGWDDDGSQPMRSGPLKIGDYELDYVFKRTATNNINAAFVIKGVPGFFMSDRFALPATEMARKINLGLPHSLELQAPSASMDPGTEPSADVLSTTGLPWDGVDSDQESRWFGTKIRLTAIDRRMVERGLVREGDATLVQLENRGDVLRVLWPEMTAGEDRSVRASARDYRIEVVELVDNSRPLPSRLADGWRIGAASAKAAWDKHISGVEGDPYPSKSANILTAYWNMIGSLYGGPENMPDNVAFVVRSLSDTLAHGAMTDTSFDGAVRRIEEQIGAFSKAVDEIVPSDIQIAGIERSVYESAAQRVLEEKERLLGDKSRYVGMLDIQSRIWTTPDMALSQSLDRARARFDKEFNEYQAIVDRKISEEIDAEKKVLTPFDAGAVRMPAADEFVKGDSQRSIRGLVDSEGWTNGAMLDLGKMPDDLRSDVESLYEARGVTAGLPDVTAKSWKGLLESVSLAGRSDVAALAGYLKESANIDGYLLGNAGAGVGVLIDRRYYNYFARRYEGCQFLADHPEKVIAVAHGGEIVGVVMPLKVDQTTARRLLDWAGQLGAERSAAASRVYLNPEDASEEALDFALAGLSGLYSGEYAYFVADVIERPHYGVGYLKNKSDGRVPAEWLFSRSEVETRGRAREAAALDVLDENKSREIANTIFQQIGGAKFRAMTGAKNVVVLTGGGLMIDLPQNFAKDKINRVTIRLNQSDTYDLAFERVRGESIQSVSSSEGVYADSLSEVFTRHTGLDTTLGKIKAVTERKPAAENASSDATLDRNRAREEIRFSVPYVGKDGVALVGYVWPNKKEEYVDSRGEERVRTVSDWESAVENLETGRQIVHQFAVRLADGTERDVSAESAALLLGVAESTVRGNAKKLLEAEIKKARALEQEIAAADRVDAIEAKESPARAVDTRTLFEYSANAPMIARMAEKGPSWQSIKDKIERENVGAEKYRFLERDGKFIWSPTLVTAGSELARRGWRSVELRAQEIWRVDLTVDPSSPEGYARIMASEALKGNYRQELHAMFEKRQLLLSVALAALGWENAPGGLLVKGDFGVLIKAKIEMPGLVGEYRSGQVVGVYKGKALESSIDDDLTKTPEQIAGEIDAKAAPAVKENPKLGLRVQQKIRRLAGKLGVEAESGSGVVTKVALNKNGRHAVLHAVDPQLGAWSVRMIEADPARTRAPCELEEALKWFNEFADQDLVNARRLGATWKAVRAMGEGADYRKAKIDFKADGRFIAVTCAGETVAHLSAGFTRQDFAKALVSNIQSDATSIGRDIEARLRSELSCPDGHVISADVAGDVGGVASHGNHAIHFYVKRQHHDDSDLGQINAEFRVFLDEPRATLFLSRGPNIQGKSVDLLKDGNRFAYAETFGSLCDSMVDAFNESVAELGIPVIEQAPVKKLAGMGM